MGIIQHKGNVIAWGYLGQDAKHKEFDSGKSVTNFSLRYGSEASTDNGGRRKNLYIDVDAWNQIGGYAANFEKGDNVVVFGRMIKDDYKSNKQGHDVFKISADMCLVQPFVGEAYDGSFADDSGDGDNGGGEGGDALPQGMEELNGDDGNLPF